MPKHDVGMAKDREPPEPERKMLGKSPTFGSQADTQRNVVKKKKTTRGKTDRRSLPYVLEAKDQEHKSTEIDDSITTKSKLHKDRAQLGMGHEENAGKDVESRRIQPSPATKNRERPQEESQHRIRLSTSFETALRTMGQDNPELRQEIPRTSFGHDDLQEEHIPQNKSLAVPPQLPHTETQRPSSALSQFQKPEELEDQKTKDADESMETLLIYRAVLFAALAALAADTSCVFETELGDRVVQVL